MLTSSLAISCVTTSNLPWFMDLIFQVLMHSALYSIGPCFYHQSHAQLGVVFDLAPSHSFFLELFLHCSPVTYWVPTDLGSSSFSVLSFCLFILFIGFSSKNTEVACHSLLQWTTFCQTSPPWPVCLRWPHTAWLSFIELDKAIVHVIRLAGFLWLWFQSICRLMPSQHLLGFLLPWTWGIYSWLLQQSTAAAPDLGCGVAPHRLRSWPWMWGSSSRPPLLNLGRGVAPLSHHSWTLDVG